MLVVVHHGDRRIIVVVVLIGSISVWWEEDLLVLVLLMLPSLHLRIEEMTISWLIDQHCTMLSVFLPRIVMRVLGCVHHGLL